MAYETTLPDGSPILTESQFAKQYIAEMVAGGLGRPKTVDVVRSWHNYQRDPAGHFLSKVNQKTECDCLQGQCCAQCDPYGVPHEQPQA
jgi:hypothetical protein